MNRRILCESVQTVVHTNRKSAHNVLGHGDKALAAHRQEDIALPGCGLLADFTALTAKVRFACLLSPAWYFDIFIDLFCVSFLLLLVN